MATKKTSSSKSSGGLKVTTDSSGKITGASDSKGSYDANGNKVSGGSSASSTRVSSSSDRDAIAQRAVETTNALYGGDPNVVAYGGTFNPGSGGYAAPATNDNYASVKPKTATYPVISADMAQKDLAQKNMEFQNILSGMQNQQVANTQLGAVQEQQKQQQQLNEKATAPNQTLNDIKNMVSGAADKQKNELEDIKVKQDEAYAGYKKQIDSIRRGTFPLTPDQQAMVDYTQRQFDRLAEQQQVSNQNYEGAIAQLGIVSGRNRYAPEIQVGLAKQAVDDGLTKIADIEAKAAMTVANLRMGFQEKNYQMINDSYGALTNYLNQKTSIINQMAGIVREEANFALSIHNQEYNEARQAVQDQQAAQEFNLKYNIPADKPFYAIGGTVYRASDRQPAHNPQEYIEMGGKGDFTDVYELTGNAAMERELVMSLASKSPEAGIKPGDSLDTATQKYKNAKAEAEYKPENYGNTPEASGYSTPPKGGFRTDRNNNPTAMTTDVARSLGLVEGRDYIVGDKFPGNSNLYTAKIIGDPIQVTIKGLDNAAQTGKGAFRTAGGKPRWSYINMSDQEWLSKTPEQKAETVKTMYQREGGSGQLAGVTPKTDTPNNDKTTKEDVTKEITDTWVSGENGRSYLQGNGKISSSDYKVGKEYWKSKNLSGAAFDTQFGYLIDKDSPNWKIDYGVGQ